MEIDDVSTHIVKLALCLDLVVPGSISEIWLSSSLLHLIKASMPRAGRIPQFIKETHILVDAVTVKRRKQYLSEMLSSLEFQIINANHRIPYTMFSDRVLGKKIYRVTENEIRGWEEKITVLEHKIGKSRTEILKKYSLEKDQYIPEFTSDIGKVKAKIPQDILSYEDKGLDIQIAEKKPWSAFNAHSAPGHSVLTLNTGAHLTKIDLYRLSSHEAYGGHHSELSNKDRLLTEDKRGEHGLVVTLSPQVYISEAIAETMYVVFGILNRDDDAQLITWYYDRLTFALQNLATFLFNDDGRSRDEIYEILRQYNVSDLTRNNILNFSCDPVFGKYAPVYYSALPFMEKLFNKSNNKERFIKTVFTQPCTASILTEEFA